MHTSRLATALALFLTNAAAAQPPTPGTEPKTLPVMPPVRHAPVGGGGAAATAYTPPDLGPWPAARVDPLLRAVDPAKLRAWHDLLASEPHIAGSAGDQRQIERIATALTDMGLEVEKHEFWAYLATPVAAVLELHDAGPAGGTPPPQNKVTPLVTKERMLPEDLDSSNPDLTWGWNAYSGSGDVTAEVIYANQGTKADFAKLKELGVDVRGKIVLCRYGGNFRGYKVKFAEAAGAVGVVITTDVAPDAGPAYPAGGTPNDTCIERGSINTLDHPGDPLTPGIEATQNAKRLDTAAVALPKIPVQPIGWGAARAIFAAIATNADDAKSPSPPLPDKWQGGINIPYRIVGGPSVKLRLKVEQKRELTKSANVIGTLRGQKWPEEWVLAGAHHDAWGFGACDPTCGTICVLEAARIFAAAAKEGKPPQRTLKFCCWGAEEFSIIGSTEWVESRRGEIEQKAVSYINLDMASMGPDFGASAAPSLKTVIAEVSRHVPAVASKFVESGIEGPTVLDAWLARKDTTDPALTGQPKIASMGGGSDHVAFWCHAGVPSCGLSAGGAKGSAYHSVYDTLRWYRMNVGDDYNSSRMVSQMAVGVMARLADDDAPPLDFARDMHDTAARLDELADLADKKLPIVAADIRALAVRARKASYGPGVWSRSLAKVSPNMPARRQAWTAMRQRILTDKGLPLREWYRNELASPDADSGYAAWFLPRLTRAIENTDIIPAKIALERYSDMIGGDPKAANRTGGMSLRPNVPRPKSGLVQPNPPAPQGEPELEPVEPTP